MALKRCIECKLDKEDSQDFYSRNAKYADGLQPRCTICHKIYAKICRDKAPKREPSNDPSILKKCLKCGEERPATIDHFHRHNKMPDGLQKTCRVCALAWSKVYYNEYPPPASRASAYLTEVSRKRRAEPALKASDAARSKDLYVELRTRVLSHYANGDLCCACCGLRGYKFLALDHVEGGGNKHRREIAASGGFEYWRWFIHNAFPVGFQVLCHSCNCAKGFHGVCPHNDPEDPDYIIRDLS